MKKGKRSSVGLIVALLVVCVVVVLFVFPLLWNMVLQRSSAVQACAEELIAAYQEETGEQLSMSDVARDVVYLDQKMYFVPEKIRGVEDGHIIYTDIDEDQGETDAWVTRSVLGTYHIELTTVETGVVSVFDYKLLGKTYYNGSPIPGPTG